MPDKCQECARNSAISLDHAYNHWVYLSNNIYREYRVYTKKCWDLLRQNSAKFRQQQPLLFHTTTTSSVIHLKNIMPRIGDNGVSGFGDDRPVLGVFSTRHGMERARQRGIRPDTLRKSSQNGDCNGRVTEGGITSIWSPSSSKYGSKLITTYREEKEVKEERRRDRADGKLYTQAAFQRQYGRNEEWEAAKPLEFIKHLPAKLKWKFIGSQGKFIKEFKLRYDVNACVCDQAGVDTVLLRLWRDPVMDRRKSDWRDKRTLSHPLWEEAIQAINEFVLVGRHHPSLLPPSTRPGEPRHVCTSCGDTLPMSGFPPEQWQKVVDGKMAAECECDVCSYNTQKQIVNRMAAKTATCVVCVTELPRDQFSKAAWKRILLARPTCIACQELLQQQKRKAKKAAKRARMAALRAGDVACTTDIPGDQSSMHGSDGVHKANPQRSLGTWTPRKFDEEVCDVTGVPDESDTALPVATALISFFCIDCGGVAVAARKSRCPQCESCYE